MPIMTFQAQISGPDGNFGAYVSEPAQPNGSALIVIQEIFGVNGVMRELADDYAAQGYLAIVPDLFWRIEPGISITDKTPEEWSRAFELFGAFDVDTGITDIAATLDYARTRSTKVGAVGYCLGGLLAYLTAARTGIDASVSYYGVSINERLEEAGKIKNPLLLHIASEDKFVPADAQAAIIGAAQTHPQLTAHVYQGLDHAFARVGGEHFDTQGAALANERTRAFFQEHLS
jgi:carboxymethylenebutenolidase